MPFNDVVDPEQHAVLSAVLDDICLAAGIELQSPDSEDAAGLLMHLHRIGCRTSGELKTTFENVRRHVWRAL